MSRPLRLGFAGALYHVTCAVMNENLSILKMVTFHFSSRFLVMLSRSHALCGNA
jgi:hypothetical protein